MTRWFRPLLTLVLLSALAAWHVPLTARPQQPAPAEQKSAVAQTAPPASIAASAEKLKREGLPNLGRIGNRLYRSGQPKKEGYDELQKLGIQIVVNLRHDPGNGEQEQVESRGMRYVSIPWNAWRGPDNRQVAEFLRLLRENPDKKVFVHCKRGAERTGVMVSAYRMAAQGWTPEQALEEMEEFKFRGFWFRHLKRYVREFPETLKTDPALQPLQPAATAVSQ